MAGRGIAETATLLDVHPTHLARTFKSLVGCSMGEYVRRLRIEEAARRLASGAGPLVEIALDAGFADQAHFSRVFKQVTGHSPGAYRKMWAGR
jgi:AraC family transcriptional regulator